MRTNMKLWAVLAALCSVLPAQDFRSTISGHVFDSSGAAVPNAKVQAINVDTNDTTTATSDGSGNYAIPLLRPGNYKVTAAAAGFKQFVRDRVILEATRAVGLDITLEVGAMTETVEVTAQAAVLDTTSASRGGVVTTTHVAELPLNARNPFMLGTMMAGVTFNGAAIWQRPFDNGAIAEWSINGSRNSQAEFILDGASNDGQMGGNNIAYVPIVDAVQEFSVMSNMYSAEYGRTGGGILNVVLKSGTNTHHITAWEYMRRTRLDANLFQNNAISAKRPSHYLDQYGFQLEGPVSIPKLLKRDGPFKLFYLGSFENYREGTPTPLQSSYPEAEMRTGDFSKLHTNTGLPITIYDPFTGTYDAAGTLLTPRQAFPGNRIPQNRIHPIAANVTKFMPLPNRAALAGSRYSTSNLVFPDYFAKDSFYNLILKFDMNFGNKHRSYFRHASNDRTEDRATNGLDNLIGTSGQQPFQRINDAYVADWVTTVSPTLILNVRASYNRFIEKGFGRANEGFDLTTLGLPRSLISRFPNQDKIYFGVWAPDGYTGLGRGQSNNYTNTYELQASGTKVWNSHTVKAGFDIRQINYLIQNTGNILNFTGSTQWTQRQFNIGEPVSGDGYATFLLGIVGGSSNYPLFPWWKRPYWSPYVQDDWKVSRKLTLNLGFRVDYNLPTYEKWNRMNGPFDSAVASPIVNRIDFSAANRLTAAQQQYRPLYDALRNLKGGMTFAGVGGIPAKPFDVNGFAWQPRVGFAYSINDRLVMRGGFARYYSNPNNDYNKSDGFSTSTPIVTSGDGNRTPVGITLNNPFPAGIQQPTGSSLGAGSFLGRDFSWFDPGFRVPNTWHFSFGFQYQLTANSTLEASYVGNRTYDLNSSRDYNIPSADFRKTCNPAEGGIPNNCNQNLPNPFKGVAEFIGQGLYTADNISLSQLQRPFPQFTGGLSQQGRNDGQLWYNSLQANYSLRMRGGLNIVANYTLSKQIDRGGFADAYRRDVDVYNQGIGALDRPHVVKLTTVWELPFGEGRKFGAGSNGFVKQLISGWQVTNFYNHALLGFPQSLPNALILKDPQAPATDANGTLLVNPLTGQPIWDGNTDWKAYQPRLWNPCVLQVLDTGVIQPTQPSLQAGCGSNFSNNWGSYAWMTTAGSGAPRYTPDRSGQIRRHTAFQLDASISKQTKIGERARFQFGVEAFNVANHNYFGRDNFNTGLTDANFGTIRPSTVSNQNIQPRQLQIRLKFLW